MCLTKSRREESHKRCKTFTLCILCKEQYFLARGQAHGLVVVGSEKLFRVELEIQFGTRKSERVCLVSYVYQNLFFDLMVS